MWSRSSVAALVAAAAFLGCSGDGARTVEGAGEGIASGAFAVLGGHDDTTHEQVVSISTVPDAPSPELCSGVVIGARLVLTAGHCVRGQTPATLLVGFGPSAKTPTRTVAVTSMSVVPRFTGDLSIDEPQGHDLGVVVLAEDAGVTPVALSHAAPTRDALARLVGFGLSSPTDVATRGTRRSADVRLGAACSLLIAFGDGTTNACHGDSGGPLLRVRSDGTEELIGIVSYGRTAACDPPSYAVRVDAYAAWLESVIAGGPPTDCAECPPEPTDCPPSEPDAGADPPLEAGADVGPALDASDAAPATDAADATVAAGPSSGGGCSSGARRTSGGALAFAVALALAHRLRRHSVRRRPLTQCTVLPEAGSQA